MKEYSIQYESFNVYEENVSEAVFDFRVLPCNDASQVVTDYKISNCLGENLFSFKNLFGFEVNRVRTTKVFKEFNFTLKAVVQKADHTYNDLEFLSYKDEVEQLNSRDFFIDHHLFLRTTPYTTISAKNLSSLLPYASYENIYYYLISLNRWVNQLLSYQKDTTDVKTTADEALTLKAGVCQDYAHIFIAICRHNKIPARYISGYLNQGKDFLGNNLMHAWVEAFVPGVGWLGFDPTNNLMVDEHYIKVSHGADYSDCSPIKGVLKTNGKNQTSYKVKVTSQQSQQQQ